MHFGLDFGISSLALMRAGAAGGGGTQPWTLEDLGPLLLRYWHADDLTDGAVASWTDRIVNHVVAQGTAASQPVKAAASFNSAHAGVTFDGSNDQLEATTGLEDLPLGNGPVTFITLASQADVSVGSSVRDIIMYGSALGGNGNSIGPGLFETGGASRAFINYFQSPIVIDAATNYQGNFIRVDTFANTSDFFLWLNGTPSVLTGTPGSWGLETAGRLRIGSHPNAAPGEFWQGVIRVAAIYAGVLSTDQRQRAEGFLAWDSGLQAALPTDHPYRFSPPMTGAGAERVLLFNDDSTDDPDGMTNVLFLAEVHKLPGWKVGAYTLASGNPQGAPWLRALRDYIRQGAGLSDFCPHIGQYQGTTPSLVRANTLYNRPVGYEFRPGEAKGDYPSDVAALRQALVDAQGPVHICTGGAATSIALLFASPGDGISPLTGTQLVANKVEHIWYVGTNLPATTVDFNSGQDLQSVADMFDNSPAPITAMTAISDWLNSNPLSIDLGKDRIANPFVLGWLMDECRMDLGAGGGFNHVGDIPPVLAATDYFPGLFNYSSPGTITVDVGGNTITYTEGAGLHRYVTSWNSNLATVGPPIQAAITAVLNSAETEAPTFLTDATITLEADDILSRPILLSQSDATLTIQPGLDGALFEMNGNRLQGADGTPSPGAYQVTLRAANAAGLFSDRTYTVTVSATSGLTPSQRILARATALGWSYCYDPTDTNARTLNGGDVASLADGLGNGPTIVQGTAANQPTLSAAHVGALDVMLGNGTDWISSGATEATGIGDTFFVMFVGAVGSAGTQRLFNHHSTDGFCRMQRENLSLPAGTMPTLFISGGSATNTNANRFELKPLINEGEAHVWGMQFGIPATVNTRTFWVDGAERVSRENSMSTLAAPNRIALMANNAGGSPITSGGFMGPHLLFNGTPTDAQRNGMFDVLMQLTTVAAPTAPIVSTFTDFGVSDANAPSYNFPDLAAPGDGALIAAFSSRAVGARTIDSVTIAGVVATEIGTSIVNTDNANHDVLAHYGIAESDVPPGTTTATVDIAFLGGDMLRCGVDLYRAENLASLTPVVPSVGVGDNTPANVSVEAGGCVIATAYAVSGALSWSGVTVDSTELMEGSQHISSASDDFADADTVAVTLNISANAVNRALVTSLR